MPAPLVESTVSEMVRWAEPLLGDVLASGYSKFVYDRKTSGPIVRCHVLLWRCVLSGDDRTEGFRVSLLRLTHPVGITEADIDALNRDVLQELMHVIALRYQRSPRSAGQYSLEVARAACRLTAMRGQPRA